MGASYDGRETAFDNAATAPHAPAETTPGELLVGPRKIAVAARRVRVDGHRVLLIYWVLWIQIGWGGLRWLGRVVAVAGMSGA